MGRTVEKELFGFDGLGKRITVLVIYLLTVKGADGFDIHTME